MNHSELQNYVQFCQEYQRQMSQIVNTYAQMNERLNYYYFQHNNPNLNNNTRRETPIGTTFYNNQRFPLPLRGQRGVNNNQRFPRSQQTNYVTPLSFTTRFDNNYNVLENFNDIFGSIFTNLLNTPQEDVIVRPSTQQIENATQIVRYDTIENPTHECCPIDLSPFNGNDNVMQIKHCKHIFHPNNLRSWFNNSVKCPMCRYDIREYNSDNNPPPETEQPGTSED